MAARLRKKYDRIFKEMTSLEFQNSRDFNLSEEDILAESGGIRHQTNLFLGYYHPKTIDLYLKKFHVFEYLSTLGLKNLKYVLDLSDSYEHKFCIYSGKYEDSKKVVEIVLRKKGLELEDAPLNTSGLKDAEFLYVEWLLLQNPEKQFSLRRPRLPGQVYPGLRIGDHVMEILYHMAKRIRTSGLANTPNYLHTAVLFSKEFLFIDPAMEAINQAIKGYLMKHYSLWTIAWAGYYDCIYHLDTGKSLEWKPSLMVLPTSDEIKNYFDSKEYKNSYRQYKDKLRIEVDRDKLITKYKEEGDVT
ncbi:MAG: hypothetical protein ACP5D8_06920 [Fidelibacterota bacterium]